MAAGAGQAGLIPAPARGACPESDGVRFRVYSSCAERVVLCLHSPQGPEQQRVDMTATGDGDWELFVPGCGPGQHYGFRVYGPWHPDRGERCNPHKLLLDPYARELAGDFHWSAAVFDYTVERAHVGWRRDERDNAPVVPRSVVTPLAPPAPRREAVRAWNESVVYETNVRGFTMAHPGLDEAERGKLRGLSNGKILAHLKALGVTTVELMPVHAFIDERHLVERGLRNLWGYNSIGFFAVAPRLAGPEPAREFRAMVAALHDAGFEVLLDVVYNHTGEGDALGPTLSFRGLDNLAYYRVEPDDPAIYLNLSGTGNTVNADHPAVQQLVLDSLRYWHQTMCVDGFRFDIAPVLGFDGVGFRPDHPLLEAMGNDPSLVGAALIAEPWGPVSYELGRFPGRWCEWNDQFRDTVRRFWRRDPVPLPDLAERMHGSPDLFAQPGRGPSASVNFVAAHDGFTLHDLVSYAQRHNEANGEDNRDGHAHNYSSNHGVEGPTDRPGVLAQRRRHRLNLLATLMFSRGVPMLLAGDEFGNTQGGNNNGYAQDNEIGWADWSGLEDDPGFFAAVCRFIAARQQHSVFSRPDYAHADGPEDTTAWFHPEGRRMRDDDWREARAVLQLLPDPDSDAVALIVNGHDREVDFDLSAPMACLGQGSGHRPAETPGVGPEAASGAVTGGLDDSLPGPRGGAWQIAASSDEHAAVESGSPFRAAAWSITLLALTP